MRSTTRKNSEADPKKEKPLRSNRFTLRLNDEELKVLEANAEQAGVKISTYIRMAALQSRIAVKQPVPEVSRQTYVELGKIGVNLNQIARILNSLYLAGDKVSSRQITSLHTKVNELASVISSIRRTIEGI